MKVAPISGCLPALDGLRSEREVAASGGMQVAGWMSVQNLERDYTIVRALEVLQHDFGRTAEVLGIHRKTLQCKLRRYGLS